MLNTLKIIGFSVFYGIWLVISMLAVHILSPMIPLVVLVVSSAILIAVAPLFKRIFRQFVQWLGFSYGIIMGSISVYGIVIGLIFGVAIPIGYYWILLVGMVMAVLGWGFWKK